MWKVSSGEMERTGQIWEKCRKEESGVVRDQTRQAVCLREAATVSGGEGGSNLALNKSQQAWREDDQFNSGWVEFDGGVGGASKKKRHIR